MPRWYYPNLSSLEAEKRLSERGAYGDFLVRPSKSCAGHFSLSVRRKDTKVTHIKIRKIRTDKGDFYDLHGGERFVALAALVQYYTENGIPEKNGEVIELKRPLNLSDQPTELWFHGSISGDVAEGLLRDKGVNGSFLVRESQSKVGDYVLTVRTKDESSKKPGQADKVTHIMIRYQIDENGDYKYDIGGGEKFNSLKELVDHYKRNPMVETTGTVVNLKYPFNATRFTALGIDGRVEELSKQIDGKEGFWEEFEHLQNQECKVLLGRKVGQDDRNMLKNRYRYIYPYDYTRVILKKPMSFKNDDNTANSINDYINANYIKLVEDDASSISPKTKPVPHSKIYIATQGPLPDTVNDFWWMVWQEKSDCIVMVTREMERGKNKCCRYWPAMEHQMSIMRCGPIEIKILVDTTTPTTGTASNNTTTTSRTNYEDDYTYREFELRYLGGDENNDCSVVRRVVQYQYHAWPDQSIPSDPSSVLNFLYQINRRPPKGPMIVHCSAGIGRSGTLIVIDMIMDQLKYKGLTYEMDIQRIVKIARAQRSGLVQTEAQYKFIYLAIQNYIASFMHNK